MAHPSVFPRARGGGGTSLADVLAGIDRAFMSLLKKGESEGPRRFVFDEKHTVPGFRYQ